MEHSRLRARVISVLLVAIAVAVAIIYSIFHGRSIRPVPPPRIVVSSCQVVPLGVYRFGFDIQFDVHEPRLAVHKGGSDSPPSVVYSVTIDKSSMDDEARLQVGVWPLAFEERLAAAWPVFSERVDKSRVVGPIASPYGYIERDVRANDGRVIGKDRWGYLRNGYCMRLVSFSHGERAGYPAIPVDEARLFDRFLRSACLPSADMTAGNK